MNNASNNNGKVQEETHFENSIYKKRVKELRESRKLTQNDFCEKIGISTTQLSCIENGKKTLSANIAIEIAKTFDVSLDWLYGLSDDKNDEASNTSIAFHKVFKIGRHEKYDDVLTVTIDNKLLDFLLELTYAEKIKVQTKMPEEAYQTWINGIKNKYNEALKNGFENIPVEYALSEYKIEEVSGINPANPPTKL